MNLYEATNTYLDEAPKIYSFDILRRRLNNLNMTKMPVEEFPASKIADTIMPISKLLAMNGMYGEQRRDSGSGVGNYSYDEWLEFLIDIATNGLKHPIVIYKGEIAEGNHRIEALKQLGYTEAPVEIRN